MNVEGVNHLSNLMEVIHKKERLFLACVADRFHDLAEMRFCHVFVEMKGGTIKHVDGLRQPPEITILDANKTQQKEDTSQPHIELLEVHRLAQSLVGLWDDQINNSLLREAHAKELELVHVRNLVPSVMDKLAGLIKKVGVCTTATILGRLPCAQRRCCSWHRRLHILWHLAHCHVAS